MLVVVNVVIVGVVVNVVIVGVVVMLLLLVLLLMLSLRVLLLMLLLRVMLPQLVNSSWLGWHTGYIDIYFCTVSILVIRLSTIFNCTFLPFCQLHLPDEDFP